MLTLELHLGGSPLPTFTVDLACIGKPARGGKGGQGGETKERQGGRKGGHGQKEPKQGITDKHTFLTEGGGAEHDLKNIILKQ